MSSITIQIPKIEGISAQDLKKDIDYLILQKSEKLTSPITTRVVVLDQTPSKVYRSREYVITSEKVLKPSMAMTLQDDDDPTLVKSRVTVEYPQQTVANVMLLGQLKEDPDGLVSAIVAEIGQYLNLFQVSVSGPAIPDSDDGADCGLGLSVSLPQMCCSQRLQIRKDIESVIKKASTPAAGPTDDKEPSSSSTSTINHKISISDDTRDPQLCLVKVALLGEADKSYYETMWDINRKIRNYMK